MSDRFTEQLSAYLDDELDDVSRARIEAHLRECVACTGVLADLRAIVALAPRYQGCEPSRDLWADIESRLDEAEVVPITTGRPAALPSAGRFGWRELIAASVVMAALGAGAVRLALGPRQPPIGTVATVPGSAQPMASRGVDFAEQKYDAAVQDLEQVLEAGRSRLDTATVRSVEQSLVKIDAAIAEARAAIQRDPANAYLSRQIAANMRRKLNLLRAATNAIAART